MPDFSRPKIQLGCAEKAARGKMSIPQEPGIVEVKDAQLSCREKEMSAS